MTSCDDGLMIFDFDVQHHDVQMLGKVPLTWKNPRLQWNRTQYVRVRTVYTFKLSLSISHALYISSPRWEFHRPSEMNHHNSPVYMRYTVYIRTGTVYCTYAVHLCALLWYLMVYIYGNIYVAHRCTYRGASHMCTITQYVHMCVCRHCIPLKMWVTSIKKKNNQENQSPDQRLNYLLPTTIM